MAVVLNRPHMLAYARKVVPTYLKTVGKCRDFTTLSYIAITHSPLLNSVLACHQTNRQYSTSVKMSSSVEPGVLVGLGNPLLDISINGDEQFLKKYDLEADNQILATEKHQKMFTEIMKRHSPMYIAGGATQNTIRVSQWLLQAPNATVFFGCVGKDEMGKILEEKAKEVGVDVHYMVDEEKQTGVCAAIITGEERSLVSRLGASRHFDVKFLRQPENWKLVERAQFFYIGGYVFPVSMDSITLLASHAVDNNKALIMNLHASYLCRYFTRDDLNILEYIDVLVGNEQEHQTLATMLKYDTSDVKEIALKVAAYPKKNNKRGRIVIVTQGRMPTIVAARGEVKEFKVPPIGGMIVDTNGCGDAFVGGFLAQFVQGRPLEDCVRCGQYAARIVIQYYGCTFPDIPEFE